MPTRSIDDFPARSMFLLFHGYLVNWKVRT
jgi:hypothetical protein